MASCSGSMEGAPIRVQRNYPIGGIQLKFPCKPYPTQMAMMAKIITALNKGENALLESPTGSGKSLALLCSSLAWLHSEKTKTVTDSMKAKLEGHQNDASMPCVCDCHTQKEQPSNQTPLHSAMPTMTTPTQTHTVNLHVNYAGGKAVPLISIPGHTPVPFPSNLLPLLNLSGPTHLAPPSSIPSSSHLAPPSPVYQFSVPTIPPSSSTYSQSMNGAVLLSGNPSTSLLPAMVLPVPNPTSILNSEAKCNVSNVVTNAVVVSTNCTSITQEALTVNNAETLNCHHNQPYSMPIVKGTCCSESSNSVQPGETSNVGVESEVPNTESTNLNSDEIKGDGIKNGELKNGEISNGEVRSEDVKSEDVTSVGEVVEKSGTKCSKEKKEVIVFDDSLDDDFKQSKKRFRTPATNTKDGPTKKKRKGQGKGVQYEDEGSDMEDLSLLPDQHGQPTWRMENKNAPQRTEVCPPPLSSYPPSTSVPTPSSAPSAVTKTSSPLVICPKCGCAQGAKDTHNAAQVDSVKARKIKPQIFFGTRTHKQITQITHEMAKTAYSETPMCILASREHTCIHPKVSKSRNKNDDCKKLRDYVEGVSCTWYHRVQQKLGSQCQLRQHGYTTAWDIEDLVKLGRRVRACPYFALRGLKEDADIIFCPYNYLIDPMIREQMLIDLESKVIILDEAHNMEDSAREAASLSFNHLQTSDVLKEITELIPAQEKGEVKLAYQKLQALCSAIIRWIDVTVMRLPLHGYEQAYGIWNGKDYLPVLEKELSLTECSISVYENTLKTIADSAKEDKEENEGLATPPPPTLSVSSQNFIKSILIVASYLFRENKRYLSDYRIALLKTATMARPSETSGFMSKRRRSQALQKVWTTSLNFWCLNPAVAFSDLTRAHSIVLTSGTLSPMTSFSSELGVKFPIQLEASHVIPEAQTWVNSISHGPNGRSLIANYQNSETFQFQDEVGDVVLRVCQTVPYGVLCFFSSYKMLEKLVKRWQDTGMWDKISQSKGIFCEPRSGRKEDFEEAISSYYQVIAESSPTKQDNDYNGGHYTGALFLAVCRGKVSEGLDFADNNARAVITIGIPFPNIKDKQVELKREYNNEHCHQRGVLTGSEWYEIQAYRALNQALGRCIRHKKDWGALILIDERYSKGHHYTKGLSKWIRQRLQHQSDFNHSMKLLQAFTESMMVDGDANDLSKSCDQSALLKSPSVSVSLGTSMSSPGVLMRNTSITSLEHVKTSENSLASVSNSKTFPIPGSPSVSPVGSTPHTSTPVAPCKSAQESLWLSHNVTLVGSCGDSCMPCSNITPANSDSTVNYAITTGCTSPNPSTTAQIPSLIPTATLSPKANQLEQQSRSPSMNTKDNTTSLSHIHTAFHYPGGHMLKKPEFVGESTTPVQTELATGIKQEDTTPAIICIEESPPNSQAVDCNGINSPKIEGNELLLSTKLADPQLVPNHTSQESVPKTASNTPDLKLVDSKRGESPVLFDTPGCIGGPQSLATKLSKLVNSNKQVACDCSDHNADFDDDKTPPISPDDKPTEDTGLECERTELDKTNYQLDTTAAAQQKEEEKMEADNDIPSKRSTTKKGASRQRKGSSALGQPRTRRVNTRMAKRKSIAESSVCGSIKKYARTTPSKVSVANDEDDFVPDKKTPRKQATVAEPMELQENDFKIFCSCGKTLSMKCASLEKLELKEALSSRYGDFKPTKIQSSKLWTHLKGSCRSRAKTLPVIIVSPSELNCCSKQEDGIYNAVWDEKVLLCYSLLQCKCGKLVGVSVHSSDGGEDLKSLNGKAILPQHEVTVN